MGKNINQFIINSGLLVFGIATVFSGMLIQVNYHIGNHGIIAINGFVFGINYYGWSAIHKISIVALSLLMICHFYLHRKWYKIVITKKLVLKNQQVLVLSFLFIAVAITGFTPWFMDLLNGDGIRRKIFIEIHDKLTLVLLIYLVLHIIKRFRWFLLSLRKLK